MNSDYYESPLEVLRIRREPEAQGLLDSMRCALTGAGSEEFYDRMEHNHWVRHCWTPEQNRDGRKHPREGVAPDTVFPWPGASDTRIPIVDEIINERVDVQMASAKRAGQQQRLMPRDLAPGQDGEAAAIAWGSVAAYYDDECQANFRTELRKVVDWKEEFGHAFLRMSWLTEQQLEKRTVNKEKVLELMVAVALEVATEVAVQKAAMDSAIDPEQLTEEERASFLTPEKRAEIELQIGLELEEMVQDEDMQAALVERLLAYDDEMPESEAKRVATELRKGKEATYYAPVVVRSNPEWRAMRPLLDGFCPPETVRVKKARWFCEEEWVSVVDLDERVETRKWTATAVTRAKEHKGKSFDPAGIEGLSGHDWVLTGGRIGFTTNEGGGATDEESEMVQVLHVYYRATSLGGIPAMYHTVVHAMVPDEVIFHECCAEAHAEYSVWDFVREPHAPSLLASRGVGEISFTQQNEMKIQRDLQADAASLLISPPVLVPLQQAGGTLKIRPGRQIPRRSTGPGGGIEPIKLVGDTSSSVEVGRACRESLNYYWQRGKEADPEMKRICRETMVDDFLTDLREVKRLTFQLIQQYAPERLRASAIGGLPVNLNVSREEIQGQFSLGLAFDTADLDWELLGKKLEMFAKLIRPLDTEGLMPVADILRTALTILMPSWARALIRNPVSVARDEVKDEKSAMFEMLFGIEPDYVPGKNHELRKKVVMDLIERTRPDGGETIIQKIMQANPDVFELIKNRLKFHDFQVEQTQVNPEVGRLGVEPVQAPGGGRI